MTDPNLTNELTQLRHVSDQLRSNINRVSMEQKARYKELVGMLSELEQRALQGEEALKLTSEAANLRSSFDRFQAHLEYHQYVAA